MRRCVLTSVTAGFDLPKAPGPGFRGADLVCLTDDPDGMRALGPTPWRVERLERPAGEAGADAARLSRMPKISPWAWLHEYDEVVWADAYFRPVGDVGALLDRGLSLRPVLLRPHQEAASPYYLADLCARRRKGDAVALREAAARWRADGVPYTLPMAAGGVVARRRCPAVEVLEAAWRVEYDRCGGRDEPALAVALWRTGFEPAWMPWIHRPQGGRWLDDGWFRWEPRTPWGPAAG